MIKNLKLSNAVTINAKDSLRAVAETMKKTGARHVFVINDDKKPVGIISATDFVTKVAAEGKDLHALKAQDIMNSPVDCADVNQEVEFAMRVMMHRKTYACLITEQGKVKGLVDYKSALDAILKKIKI